MEKATSRARYTTVTPLGKFKSLRKAADAHGVTAMAIKKRIDNKAHSDYYKLFADGTIDAGTVERRAYKAKAMPANTARIKTPKGLFDTAMGAAEAHNVTEAKMIARLNNNRMKNYVRLGA